MNRTEYIGWKWTDTFRSIWKRKSVSIEKPEPEPDPELEAFDAQWTKDLEQPGGWSKYDKAGRIACMIVVIAAAVWMVCGCIPR